MRWIYSQDMNIHKKMRWIYSQDMRWIYSQEHEMNIFRRYEVNIFTRILRGSPEYDTNNLNWSFIVSKKKKKKKEKRKKKKLQMNLSLQLYSRFLWNYESHVILVTIWTQVQNFSLGFHCVLWKQFSNRLKYLQRRVNDTDGTFLL